MGRAKIYVCDVAVSTLSYELKKDGDRAVDEAKFKIVPNQNIENNDEVRIIQDSFNVDNLSAVWTFQQNVLNGAGTSVESTGSTDTPRSDIILEFECDVSNDGFRNNTPVANGCPSYIAGKSGEGIMAIDLDGCDDYITLSNQCEFNYDLTTGMSFNFWINTSSTTAAPIIAKKATGIGSTGWDVSMDACGQVVFDLLNTACSNELKVTSDFIINDGNWHMVSVTYSGIPSASSVTMYENGSPGTFMTCIDTLSGSIQNCEVVSVGAYADGSSNLTASLDDTRIIGSKEINSEEVSSLFLHEVFEYVTGKFGESARFNGEDSYFSVPDDPLLSFSSRFDIYIWAKWTSTATQYMMAKRTLAGNGVAISINRFSTGDISAEMDGKFATATGTFNDDQWHLIRVYRDSANIIHIVVDDTEEDTVLQASNMFLSTPLLVGTNHNKTSYFAGDMNILRVYNGGVLSTKDATRMYTNRNGTSITKFGGFVTKISKEMDIKNVTAQSFGKILGETEIRGEIYLNRSPEFIIEDLVKNNTELITHIHGAASGTIITTFTADGKLLDIVRNLSQLTGKSFYTDGLRQFHLHDELFTCSASFTLEHGVNSQSFVTKFDDTEIVNDLVVLGENKRYSTNCVFSGDGCTTTFQINNAPVVSKVTVGCTEQTPEEDFNVCAVTKELVFECAPACGACNICITYEYELPLYIRGVKQSSINDHGRHAKRLIAPWITNRQDGIKYINGYINKFKNVKTNLTIQSPIHLNSISEGHIITVVNNLKGINGTYIVKSIKYLYPQFTTTVDVGEFTFDDLEYDKQIAQKIHDLEGAITTIKDIREFESFEEIMGLCDSFTVLEACSCGTLFTEPLCLTDAICVSEVTVASYGNCISTYNGGQIYGTDPPSGGFTVSGFACSGFTVNPIVYSGDICGSSYDCKSFDAGCQTNWGVGLIFNNTGSKMYVSSRCASHTVYEYCLSTSWDVSTSTYNCVSFSPTEVSSMRGITFNCDGTKIYALCSSGGTKDTLYQYSVTCAYDLSCVSYDCKSICTAGWSACHTDVMFNDDGSKVILTDDGANRLLQWGLCTPYDLGAVCKSACVLTTGSQTTVPTSSAFSISGDRAYVVETTGCREIFQYDLCCVYDISSSSYSCKSYTLTEKAALTNTSMYIKPDGTKFYVLDLSGVIHQYTLS